jgi:hypothetical protein
MPPLTMNNRQRKTLAAIFSNPIPKTKEAASYQIRDVKTFLTKLGVEP